MVSNNSAPKDWGSVLGDKVKGKKPNSNIKPGPGQILAGAGGGGKKGSGSSSSGGSGGGYSSGGSGGGGGAAMPEGPTKQEARAIVMSGMKDYLGREASAKEVKNFFKKFKEFAEANDNNVSSGIQEEFMQDWIEDRPKLRKEQAQYQTATNYMSALDEVIGQARSL